MARYILWLAFATGAVVRAVAESEGSVSPLVLWSRSNPAAFGDERSLSSLDTVARLTSWIDSRLEGPRAPELVIVLRGGSEQLRALARRSRSSRSCNSASPS